MFDGHRGAPSVHAHVLFRGVRNGLALGFGRGGGFILLGQGGRLDGQGQKDGHGQDGQGGGETEKAQHGFLLDRLAGGRATRVPLELRMRG
ncbi:hypothetical protein GD604_02180 [Desulfolutivibrio sulfoxidireducens]|nr:hypothetical protein GD604_02180 [Desulfolutivibrio sulfoxidireducens]